MNCIRIVYITILFVFSYQYVNGQDKYFISFKDKEGVNYTLENPYEFLSNKSVERRLRQNIPINQSDLPVSAVYTNMIKETGAKILYTLRWFNGVVVEIFDNEIIKQINEYDFVTSTKKIFEQGVKPQAIIEEEIFPAFTGQKQLNDFYNYGSSGNQIKMLNGHYLHNKGYRGQGVTIAVIDAGFYRVNSFVAFTNLWLEGRIIATKDFVNPSSNIFDEHAHGSMVLSVMAGYVPGELVGTAPEANYILIRSEDVNSEQIIEEYNWAAALEYSDSIGVDITNTSLGYNQYDAAWQNHTYSNLDGSTTPSARAANFASDKGMLVVVSAGNEGSTLWKHITTPADAFKSLTVGAVNSDGAYVTFSSVGPTADGRIKPDVAAQGSRTVLQNSFGNIGTANGTSFAAPIISGLAACLWQALPHLTAEEISTRIKLSASISGSPNNQIGFGLPNFITALDSLPGLKQTDKLYLFPNPTNGKVFVRLPEPIKTSFNLSIISNTGVIIKTEKYFSQSLEHTITIPEGFPSGVYIVHLESDKISKFGRVVKYRSK
jgi:serine protease AprX